MLWIHDDDNVGRILHPASIYRKPNEFKTVYPADVILFEGILVFYYKTVRTMFDMKLFVDTDADIRLTRRGERFVLIT